MGSLAGHEYQGMKQPAIDTS